MEENNEMPCSSTFTKVQTFTKVFAVVLCDQVDICDLTKTFEEKFEKVCNIEPLEKNHEYSITGVHINFEKPEQAGLAIQAKMIKMHNEIPVHIFSVHDEHQEIDFNSPIPCSAGHIHYLPLQLSAEQEADTSLLQRSCLDETKAQCSNRNNSLPPRSSDNVGSDDPCKITILNDDCLHHVFSFLNKKELIKIERVCKWWQSVSLSCWSSFKDITMKDIVHPFCSDTLEGIMCVLKRCGKYVKKLDIRYDLKDRYYYRPVFDYRAVDYIAEYCSSLRELYINHADICPVSCRALSNAVKQLEILHISECHELNDESLGTLLTKCQNLKDLSITDVDDFSGKCLSSLNPNTMERLMMYKQLSLTMDEFVPALKMMKNLKCLEMDDMDISSCEVFSSLLESLPKLESFVYKDVTVFSNHFHLDTGMKTFGNLVNLTYLNVHNNGLITDQVLLEIISNCVNIKRLVLSGCSDYVETEQESLTDFGVRKLANLRQLQDLSLSNLEYVTDHSLEALALAGTLIKLEIRGNSEITDNGCGKVVSLCKYLENFDMSGCTRVTDLTVMSAEAAVQSRTTDKILHLIVGGTRVSNFKKWKNVSPLLIVDPSDLQDRLSIDRMYEDDYNGCGYRVRRPRGCVRYS